MPQIRHLVVIAALLVSIALSTHTAAQEKPKFTLAWSIYVGFMPWAYMDNEGILDKWANKYGIEIDIVQINDYLEAINMYTAGRFDGAAMTNMDLLTIPAASGVDTTALIVGDYSNGNDAVVLKNCDELKNIKGLDVYLLELSVSHYTLARALDSVGLSERDVRVVNTSDADIAAAFSNKHVQATTVWNPQLADVMQHAEAVKVFDSTQIPGEILDIMAVRTETLKKHPELGKAVTGAWFETMAIINGSGPRSLKARQYMADASGTDVTGLNTQIDATHFFYTPKQTLEFLTPEQLKTTMTFVSEFSFKHGLLGEAAKSPTAIGIELPDGTVLGDKNNVNMRFNQTFVRMAAQETL